MKGFVTTVTIFYTIGDLVSKESVLRRWESETLK